MVTSVLENCRRELKYGIHYRNDRITGGIGSYLEFGSAAILGCHVFDSRFHEKAERMSLLEFLILLLIASTIGALGELLGRYSPEGSLVFVFLGFAGAYLGKWLAEQLNLPELARLVIGSFQFPVLWSMIVSVFLVSLLCLYQRLHA
jgi:uncharacterized membrane protein YeaQ/YmgE (transglycosylase-associated protein family)